MRARGSMPESSEIVVEIAGRIDRADIPALCERVRVALEGGGVDLVVCELGALAAADCVAVEALARMQLSARRLGRRLYLRNVSPELSGLLYFVGLGEVVGEGGATSGVESRRQPE